MFNRTHHIPPSVMNVLLIHMVKLGRIVQELACQYGFMSSLFGIAIYSYKQQEYDVVTRRSE